MWRRKIFQDVSSELRAAFQHAEALRHATEIHAYRMGLRLSLATEWGIPFRRPPDTASVAQPRVDEDEVPVASGYSDPGQFVLQALRCLLRTSVSSSTSRRSPAGASTALRNLSCLIATPTLSRCPPLQIPVSVMRRCRTPFITGASTKCGPLQLIPVFRLAAPKSMRMLLLECRPGCERDYIPAK